LLSCPGVTTGIRDTSHMDTPIERRRRPIALWLIAGGIGALALFLALRPLARRWAAADQSVELDRLRLARVTRGELIHDVAAQGRVVAASRPTLFSPAPGIVTLRVREGMQVHAGGILAVVASPELASRLQQERASLDGLVSDIGRLELSSRQANLANEQRVALGEVELGSAEREVARMERLTAEGLIHRIELEKAHDLRAVRRLELEQARQRVEIEREMFEFQVRDARSRAARQRLVVSDVERQIAELEIRAPFDGMVATVSIEDADAVVRGQPLVGVVDLADLEVEVAIPESYADDVAPGLPALVRVDAADVPGRLTSVAPEVRNSQVAGRIAFDGGPPPGLRQNQRVSARLLLDEKRDVLKVPRGPFLEAGGGRAVYVVSDGLARRRTIVVGTVSVTEVEILEGLSEGEEIVLSDLGVAEGAETVLLRD
jgi:HlyD family secretion protein